MPRSPVSPHSESFARLLAAGPLALDDREALQLAAGLSASQVDALFDEFGSLPEALGATPAELARRLPAGQAARLPLLRDLARRLAVAPLRSRAVLSGWEAVADYLRVVLAGLPREQLRGLFLDKRNRLIRG